ncbi:MAG: TonB family protein [Bacteroidales bacterium]|nr:TonB family protein [Bacteroidales bacterium]
MMTPFLLYLLRASLYLAIFYAFYLLVMRRTTLFRFNRITLLAGTVLCHLLPLLRLRVVFLPEVSFPVSSETLKAVGEPAGASAPTFPWLMAVYAAGLLAVLALILVSAVRTVRLIRRGMALPCEGCRLTLLEQDLPSFSWGRHVVMSRADYERYPAILAHELQHIRCRHSLDVLLMSAVCALHWFNPLVWIARAELKLLHEYEADEGLIRQGIDATSYQLLLVRKAVGEQRFSLANGFDHAKLKQRITMMQHTPTSGWMRLAYAALLPLLAGTMFLCNPARAEIRPATPGETALIQDDDPPVPYSQIEKKPTFQGEDAGTFARWVAQHLSYPAEAKSDGIQGRVLVSFDICEDGVVRNVKVLRGVHETLDAEAVRVISSSPKWEPGIQDGKPVKVSFQFPVIFKLNGDEPATAPSTITIRKADGAGDPLIYLDGEKFSGKISDIDVSTVQSMEVLKDAAAIEKYGEEAKNGVILIKTKK